MSSRREVLIRIALLQRKTLIETKNRTLKWYSTPVLTEDAAFVLFFRPHPGDLIAQESPPPGICHSRQKKKPMPRGQPGGVGGWSQLELTDAFLVKESLYLM